MSNFTFDNYKNILQNVLVLDYQIITLKEFFSNEYELNKKIFINRIDVDFKIDRLNHIYTIFKDLNITASIYLRLHSPNYNLLSIGNIKIIQKLIEIGCEIGLHTELEDVGNYCGINKQELLRKQIQLLETICQTKIYGTASHGDITPYNNLDFWNSNLPQEYGLLYEAYDKRLWDHCRYVSDSEWVQWKAYENGIRLDNDRRTPLEHLEEMPPIFHLLTHPESWYNEYIHE